MKLIVLPRGIRLGWVLLGCCLLTASVFALIIGYMPIWHNTDVYAAIVERDKYETRTDLLMQALTQVGVCTPEDAAETWANGLRMRSAALQYAVMSTALKDEYARQLETSAPNWVTGMSSPWIQSYEFIRTETPEVDRQIIELNFFTMTSTGPSGEYRAVLTIQREDTFWRITRISADEGLYPYTRFRYPGS